MFIDRKQHLDICSWNDLFDIHRPHSVHMYIPQLLFIFYAVLLRNAAGFFHFHCYKDSFCNKVYRPSCIQKSLRKPSSVIATKVCRFSKSKVCFKWRTTLSIIIELTGFYCYIKCKSSFRCEISGNTIADLLLILFNI